MKKINTLVAYGLMNAEDIKNRVSLRLSKKKSGSDEIVMKVGFIAVALAVFTLWKTGILNLVTDWIGNMSTQSANFWS